MERFGFSGRSKESQLQAIRRFYPDHGTDYANRFAAEFIEDTHKIENCLAWFKLSDVYQFSLNYDYATKNRLTHTVDAQQIAEEIARRLKLADESIILAGNIARVHDFGHMPFAHRGEVAAQKALQPYGIIWNHDISGIRLIAEWLKFSPAHPGLNLTHDVIEGLCKRFWRYDPSVAIGRDNHAIAELPSIIHEIDSAPGMDLHLTRFNHLEGQIAAQSDRLAFSVSDLEDGLKTKRIELEMLRLHFPLALEIYEQVVADFITEFKRSNPAAESIQLRSIIDTNEGIRVYLYTLFTDRLKELLVADIVANTNANLVELLTTNPTAKAEDVRSYHKLVASFSPSVEQQLRGFGRFCREVIFQKTAPLETLVARVIDLFVSGQVQLPAQWQAEWIATVNPGQRVELVCKYLTCEVGDQDLLEIAKQHIPDIYQKFFPGFEALSAEILSEEQVTDLLLHKQVSDQAHTTVGLPIIYLSQVKFGPGYSIPVVSTARKFVIPVPSEGETIQVPTDGYYLSGEKYYKGDPLKTISGEIIGGTGVVFFNQTDDQWLAARTGFSGMQRNVIIFNQVDQDQAEQLVVKLMTLAPEPEQITLAQVRELLEFGQTLGLTNRYPSTVLDIKQMMDTIDLGPSSLQLVNSPYGYKQRKSSLVCQATYVPGRGKFQQLFSNPQRFYNGAVLLKHPNQRTHIIQPQVFENTYGDLNGNKLNRSQLPVQNIQAQNSVTIPTQSGELLHIVIIGGGVSGVMALTKLVHKFLEQAPPQTQLKFTMIESAARLGGPTYNRYGVNIGMANPIKDLGFDTARSCVDHFNRNPEKWQAILHNAKYDSKTGFDPDSIIHHNQYGEYVRSHFNSLLKWVATKGYPISVDMVQDQVVDIDSSESQTNIILESGKQISSHAAVICIGNVAPKPLTDKNGDSLAGRKGYYNLDDHGLSPENVNEVDFTVLVGTGNGALFAVIAAIQNGYKGRFLLASRTGKTPAVAKASKLYSRTIFTLARIEAQADLTADFIYQLFQQELEYAANHGFRWRDVVDSMFVDTNKIWRLLSESEQVNFIKKYGVEWGHARYRLPNDHHDFIRKLVQDGRVEITGGLESIEVLPSDEFCIHLKQDDGSIRKIFTKKIVNNSGPTKLLKYMPTIIEKLSARGAVRQHAVGALAIDDQFRIKRLSGEIDSRLYAIGPIVSGAFLEAMTIPAIRENAETMADALINNLVISKLDEYKSVFSKVNNSAQIDYIKSDKVHAIPTRLR